MVDFQEFASDLRNYFKCCPVCFSSAKGTFKVHLTLGERDTLSCNICGSIWYLYITPFRGFEWAELDSPARDGRGREFIGRKLDRKVLLTITQRDQTQNIVKEVIREKEVITKIRCSYCKASYNEVLSSCPNCGAKS